MPAPTTTTSPAPADRAGVVVPGLAACLALGLAAVGVATAVRPWAPALSPLLLAILAGLAWRNLDPVPERLTPGVTFAATLAIGRALRLPWDLTALVASGFSICGAAAVAAADSVVRARREMAATAIGLVVLFGTLMIPLMPLLTGALGLDERTAGLWIGASTHEVAQVVAAGGLVGGAALSVAVTVKLARVVMLAPVMTALA
ncbi:putative sulfate exporter family transporter [Micrococcus endophyticus]|uniref:putative sulfate exporter family transporter n=1 Tax=Micrococcus endophyticus TaxID=455343 RepID=UPI0020063644|nr:putative sulfate exporter family transporter [Micrococcus endophyticus]